MMLFLGKMEEWKKWKNTLFPKKFPIFRYSMFRIFLFIKVYRNA